MQSIQNLNFGISFKSICSLNTVRMVRTCTYLAFQIGAPTNQVSIPKWPWQYKIRRVTLYPFPEVIKLCLTSPCSFYYIFSYRVLCPGEEKKMSKDYIILNSFHPNCKKNWGCGLWFLHFMSLFSYMLMIQTKFDKDWQSINTVLCV